MRYDLYHTDGGQAGELFAEDIALEVVAREMQLNEDEIEWAIESEGRCDGETLVAVEAGAGWPGDYEPPDPMAHVEFPFAKNH